MLPANVVTPEMFTLSNSVCPSTSKSPLASMLPANVDAADTLTSSKFVRPSTSKFPAISTLALASIAAAKVATPA